MRSLGLRSVPAQLGEIVEADATLSMGSGSMSLWMVPDVPVEEIHFRHVDGQFRASAIDDQGNGTLG